MRGSQRTAAVAAFGEFSVQLIEFRVQPRAELLDGDAIMAVRLPIVWLDAEPAGLKRFLRAQLAVQVGVRRRLYVVTREGGGELLDRRQAESLQCLPCLLYTSWTGNSL